MKITDNQLESLLENESFNNIITLINNVKNPSNETLLYKGIAYYKLNQFIEAESIFETLNINAPSNEITVYLIICKIKCEKLMDALQLYTALCTTQNETIINFIQKNDYENALNLTLFLKSIPLNLPKKETTSNELIDLIHANDYANASLILAEKQTQADL